MRKIRTCVTALTTCLLLSATSTSAQRRRDPMPPPPAPKPVSAEMRMLENEFKGKAIVLKQPLYTLLAPEPIGINTISPDKGMFFRFVHVGGVTGLIDISDGDANRLKERVVAAKPVPRSATPPQLLTYAAGTKLRVRGFDWGVEPSRIIKILLDDEFANPGGLGSTTDRPTTSLTILWPVAFSPEFSERTSVEALISQVADLERQ